LLPLLAAGCGLGLFEETTGGGDNLPTAGAGPYEKVEFREDSPITEPVVLEERFASLRDPSALPRDDGGFLLWFTYAHADAEPGTSEIHAAELPSLHDLPDRGPQPAIAADAAWEAGRVAAPSVVALPGGALAMIYEAGPPDAPALGRADSDDGGRTWRKHPDNPVADGLSSPAIALALDGAWVMIAMRAGADGLFRADSPDGVAWTLAPDPVVTARPDEREAFDRAGVADPHLVIAETAIGRTRYGVFFAGAAEEEEDAAIAVGYAGSFDGWSWQRLFGPDPVLAGNLPSEHAPTAILDGTRGVMFVHEISAGKGQIVAAEHP
jgi:hypothetical protein